MTSSPSVRAHRSVWPIAGFGKYCFCICPLTTEALTTKTIVTTPPAGPLRSVVVAAFQASAVTQTTVHFKTTKAAALIKVSSIPTLDPAFAVFGAFMSSAAASSQRPSVQNISTGRGSISFPTVASLLLQPTVVPNRRALLPSSRVDNGATPSPRYAFSSTGHYSGAFESVSFKD